MVERVIVNLRPQLVQASAGDKSELRRSRSSGRTVITKRDAIKLACTTVFDPHDRAGFGSRTYYQLQAMRSQLRVMHFIGPLSHIRPVAPLLFAKREFYRRMRGKSYHPRRDRLMVKDYSRQIQRRLAKLDVDIVFSPLSPCSAAHRLFGLCAAGCDLDRHGLGRSCRFLPRVQQQTYLRGNLA
jgi:hypothetical protein